MKKHILVISPTPSHPQDAGNRARIFSLSTTLQNLGHRVSFLYAGEDNCDQQPMQRYWKNNYYHVSHKIKTNKFKKYLRKIYKKLKLELAYTYAIDDWYNINLDKFIQDSPIKDSVDIVIVEYVFLSKVLQCFSSKVLKIIDTHDVFANRHKLFLDQGKEPVWFSTSVAEEKKGLQRANKIIAIQDKEKAYYEKLVGQNVITVGHVVPIVVPIVAPIVVSLNVQTKPVKPNRPKILYVGSKNDINLTAITFFIIEVLPLIQTRVADVELCIAGNICDRIEDHTAVTKLGRLDKLDLAYQSATLVINPIKMGTGLKIKNIEALGLGKPLVTTSVGAEGLDHNDHSNFLVADTAIDFANAVVKILIDENKAEELCNNAYEYAQRWNENCTSELNKLIQRA